MDTQQSPSRKARRRLSIPRATTPFGRILEHLTWLASGKGVGAVLSLFYLAIVTRTLGPGDFGRFALITGAATAINMIVGFNMWQVVVKYGQGHVRERDSRGLGRLIAFCAALDMGAALVGCVIAGIATLGFGAAMGLPDALGWQSFLFACVLMLTIRSTPTGVLRLLNRFDAGAISETMIPIVRMAGALAALAAGPTIAAFLLAWAAAELVCALTYWMLALRAVRADVGPIETGGFTQVGRQTPGLMGFMFTTNISSTLSSLGGQFPVLLVGAATGPTGAGFYRLGNQLSQSLTKASTLFSRSLYSELAHVHANYSKADLRALFRKTSLVTLGVALLTASVVLLLGKPVLLAMSGPAYAGAYPLLAVLGVASSIALAGVGFEPLLLATNGARQSLTFRIVTTLILFAALAVLLPRYGAMGAASSVLIMQVANFLLLGAATRWQLRD
ncbi:MAG: polysaccharide biosynthesis protein [Sphingobium sp.]|nr:MAG: polysaccharide biosynthesis protein [Sphingobium sp.]